MGTRKVEQGEVGRNVAAQVRRHRKRRKLSLQGLSERMTAVGRPMLASGLSKVEHGDRRVDADDLVALAAALEVIPAELLLPTSKAPMRQLEEHEAELKAAVEAIRACEDVGLTGVDVLAYMDLAETMRQVFRHFTEGWLSDDTRRAIRALRDELDDEEDDDGER